MNKFVLELYVAGEEKAKMVEDAVRKVLDETLEKEYDLNVIDILYNPQLAIEKKVFLTPTLRREIPLPIRSIIGDLTQKEKILIGLDIKENLKGEKND